MRSSTVWTIQCHTQSPLKAYLPRQYQTIIRTMSVLTLSQIRKSFNKNLALDDVSLTIDSGEFICLLGASGCGKTTLLRIIAGLETHDSGTIDLNGSDLADTPCHKRNIGMVFQSLALFPHLTVGKNIAYGLKMRGSTSQDMNAQVNHLLNMVGLDGFESRSVASLSGGQRQRVAIARALALEPQLFLMDEPFSALDAGLRDHLQQEIVKLQRKLGITTIFVTHDQREAMALADRIVILHEGKVEQIGTPAQIYQEPATRFVADFIGDNNILPVDISNDAHNAPDNGSNYGSSYGSTNGIVNFANHPLGPAQGALKKLQGKYDIAIRPELISISRATGDNAELTGIVSMRRPVGALIEHEIDVEGHVIKQTCFQSSESALSVGESVTVSWDWSKVWVLPQ